jgi:hypothetical protein
MEAVAINDLGLIASWGRLSDGEHRAVILTHATGSARLLKTAGILKKRRQRLPPLPSFPFYFFRKAFAKALLANKR